MTVLALGQQELSYWGMTDTVVKGGGVTKVPAALAPDDPGIPCYVEQMTPARAKRVFGIDSRATYRAVVDAGWAFTKKDLLKITQGTFSGQFLLVEDVLLQEGSEDVILGLRDSDHRPDL